MQLETTKSSLLPLNHWSARFDMGNWCPAMVDQGQFRGVKRKGQRLSVSHSFISIWCVLMLVSDIGQVAPLLEIQGRVYDAVLT